MEPASRRLDTTAPAESWTDIRIGAAVVGGLELGFNPGETADFVLGFVGIDLYGDDLESAMDRRLTVRVVGDDGEPVGQAPLVIDADLYRSDPSGFVITERLSSEDVRWGWLLEEQDVDSSCRVDWQGTLEVGNHDQSVLWIPGRLRRSKARLIGRRSWAGPGLGEPLLGDSCGKLRRSQPEPSRACSCRSRGSGSACRRPRPRP